MKNNQNTTNNTMEEEGNIITPYSALTGVNINQEWGAALLTPSRLPGKASEYAAKPAEIVNVYTSSALNNYLFVDPIRAALQQRNEEMKNYSPNSTAVYADLGGGDGFLAQEMYNGLQAQSGQIKILSLDSNPSAIEQIREKQRQQHMSSEITGIEGSVLELPHTVGNDISQTIGSGELFAASMRFVLPYFGEERQGEALQRIYDSLAPNGILVMYQDGVGQKQYSSSSNQLFSEINNVFRPTSVNYYPSLEEISELSTEAGFHIEVASDMTQFLESWISAKHYASRFKMSEESEQEINKIIARVGPTTGLPMTKENDEYLIRRPFTYTVLRK